MPNLSGPNVVHIVAGNTIDVEVSGIEFTIKQEPSLFILVEWWAEVATVLGKRIPVPGDIGEFEGDIVDECLSFVFGENLYNLPTKTLMRGRPRSL